MILAAVALAGWTMVRLAPMARAADGTAGFTVLMSASPALAAGVFAGALLVTAAVGAAVAACGNILAGPFVIAASLAMGAAAGGTIEPWLRRAESSTIYFTWAAETLFWAALMWLVAGASMELGLRWGGRIGPRPADIVPEPHPADSANPGGLAQLSPASQSALALPLAVVIGSLIGWLLVPTPPIGQVMWGLAATYAMTGLAVNHLLPRASPLAILLSPLLTGGLWYLAMGTRAMSGDALLASLFHDELWHPLLILPAQYASAGVAGAAMGIGWSQYLSAGAPR